MKKNILKLFTLTIVVTAFNSCVSNLLDKKQIDLEKKMGTNFLNTLIKEEYDSLQNYLSDSPQSDEDSFSKKKMGFIMLMDSLGSIKDFELLQLKTYDQHKTGSSDESGRKYVYTVTTSKGNKLKIDLVFDIHPENENINKERKIDFVSIDTFEE